MRKIIFLVNPISGTSKKEVVLKYIETAFKKEKIDFEIIPTDPGGNYDFLKYKIQQEHITDVIVIGGDGSVNQVVQSLHTEPVRFGIIPLGSGNGFALAANIPRNLQKAILNDGLLDVVIVQKMNNAKLPFAILKQLRGNNKLQQLVEDISKKNVLYFQTHSLNIKNLKYAPLHIDGEPMETAQEVKFEIIRNCFKLIQH